MTFFTFSIFFVFGLLFMSIVFFFYVKEENKYKKFLFFYFAIFTIYFGFSLKTIHNYIYPEDPQIFKNTDYHILEHLGFQFKDSCFIFNEKNPKEALYDDKGGLLKIQRNRKDTFHLVSNYLEVPLYIKKKNEDNYSLFNPNNKYALKVKDSIYISKDSIPFCTIILKEKENYCHYIFKIKENDKIIIEETSKFKVRLKEGYPLEEILYKTSNISNIKIYHELEELLKNFILVREQVKSPKNRGKNFSDLFVFYKNSSDFDILIDGKKKTPNYGIADTIKDINNASFYTDWGYKASKIFELKYIDKNANSLKFTQSAKFPLIKKIDTNQLVSHFIISKTDKILQFKNDNIVGGYFFERFSRLDNVNHIRGSVKYFAGSSHEKMQFEIADLYDKKQMEQIKNTNDIFVLKSKKIKKFTSVDWQFQFTNLRAESNLQIWHIFAFLSFIFALIIFRFILFDSKDYMFSRLELMLYIIIYTLLTFRVFINWRMLVFKPIKNIGLGASNVLFGDFNLSKLGIHIEINTHFIWTCIFTLIFFLLIYLISWLKSNKYTIKQRIFSNGDKSDILLWMIFIILFFSIIIFVSGLIFGGELERIYKILLPVLFYFFFMLSFTKEEAYKNSRDNFFINFINFIKKNSSYSRPVLALIILLYLFVFDAGYSIMFVFYLLIHYSILLMKEWQSSLKKLIIISLLIISCVLIFIYQENIIVFFIETVLPFLTKNNILTIAILFCIFIISISLSFEKFRRKMSNAIQINTDYKFFRILFIFSLLLIGLYIYGICENKIEPLSKKFTYLKYRAEIINQDKSIEALIKTNKFDSKNNYDILRAAQNQWLINYYLSESDSTGKYFHIQPHFIQGASHITQTTDLVVPRYVISEHSKTIVIFLCLFFISLSIFFYFNFRKEGDDDALKRNYFLLGIPILLSISAIFVFLTSTNSFTFFGQDFPLISITSKLTLFIVFILFLFLIYFFNEDEEEKEDTSEEKKIYAIPSFLLVIVLIFYILKYSNSNFNLKSEHFDINPLIKSTNIKLKKIDNLFVKFQKTKSTSLKNLSINNILDTFNISEEFKKNKIDTIKEKFFNSAYKNFINIQKDKQDNKELIHLRKRGNYWHFALNRKYFFIKSPKKDKLKWKGDLLAANTVKESGLVNQNNEFKDIKYTIKNKIKPNLIDNIFFDKDKENHPYQNIHIVFIPSTWDRNKEKIYLIREKNRSDFTINKAKFILKNKNFNLQNFVGNSLKDTIYVAVRFKLGDYLILIRNKKEENDGIKYKYVTENDNFLATNFWLNGKNSLFYPLGKNFIWSYNFANLLNTQKIARIIKDTVIRVSIDFQLTNNLHEIIYRNNFEITDKQLDDWLDFRDCNFEDKKGKNKVISLDKNNLIKLNNQYEELCKNINKQLKKNKKYKSEKTDNKIKNDTLNNIINKKVKGKYNFSCVAIDGNGKIRLILDCSKNPKQDPNNIAKYNAFLNNLYQNSSNKTERDYFGNRCLMKTDLGVGSTFKPIAYAAITSQAKIDWKKLNLTIPSIGYEYFCKKKGKKLELEYYAGKKFKEKNTWYLAKRDYGKERLKHNTYLTHSNNLYHSAIIFMGSFSEKALESKDLTNKILKPYPKKFNKKNRKQFFPKIVYKNKSYAFTHEWPDFSKSCALSNGLNENFHLIVKNDNIKDLEEKQQMPFGNITHVKKHTYCLKNIFDKGAKNKTGFFYWTFPEFSLFKIADRQSQPIEVNGLKQPSLGAFPIQVTPLKMAEMGARLFSLNRAFEITLNDNDKQDSAKYKFFNIGSNDSKSWTKRELFEFYQSNIYKQMYNVIQKGTASKLKNFIKKYEKYNFYAKTGTMSDKIKKGDKRNKHLLLIISNKEIHNNKKVSYNDFSNPKFRKEYKYYSIFISYYGVENSIFNWHKAEKVIKEIIESETFKLYMQEK